MMNKNNEEEYYMNLETGSIFPINIAEEGTVMDYVDDEFVFVIKDEEWTDFELDALKKKPLEIQFVYKFDIAVFLLTLEDAIETSDFIFSCHDNEYQESLWKTFASGDGYMCTLYLINKDGVIRGKRRVRLSATMSDIISEKLRIQRDVPYYEEEFAVNLEGLQNAYEPFELQPIALASESFT